MLIRTDSAGNLLWKRTYGGSQIDGMACAAYRDDGDIMLHYTQSYQTVPGGELYHPVFAVVDDASGAVRQIRKMSNFTYPEDMFSHNLLKDGNKYIASGQLEDKRPGTTGGFKQAYTLAVDENLNDIWFRQYHAQGADAPIDDWSVLFDLRPTSDGGYISGGYINTSDTTQLNVHLGFNGWIVKMDSMGCVEQSCVNRIGVEEQVVEEAKVGLEVFPNPSSDVFHLKLSSKLNGTAILYDLKGQKLQETLLIRGVGILNPQRNIPPGMYVAQVTDEGGNSISKKVIIQE